MNIAIMQRYVYFFGEGEADGGNDLKHLVGGKGASLAEMSKAQLNVPPGFTISAECCDLYHQAGKTWPMGLAEEIRANLERLEKVAARPFGKGDDPLLVAVRSGAAQSMPGMMDTVLNVGLNPDCVAGMASRTGNPCGAWEAYQHFLVMFGHTVGGVDERIFQDQIAEMLRETGKSIVTELDAPQREALCGRMAAAYRQQAGRALPTDPWEMLCQAINAVFGSWNNDRAMTYRRHHQIEGLLGTAVNVQMMCPSEVSGVMFTANPVNPVLDQILVESSFGLGEAIVLGKVTPDRFAIDKRTRQVIERTISVKEYIIPTLAQDGRGQTGPKDQASLSDAQIEELVELGLRVEAYFQIPCDIEWALSQGKFYLLQSRAIKGVPKLPAADRATVLTSLEQTRRDETERVRWEEIEALLARTEPGGTIWSRFNLAEILPEPTPMTWAIVSRFMSGRGGFGLMYRDLGFDPDPALDDQGIYDLVCGRPYCNLNRQLRLQFRRPPFEYPFAAFKADPQKAVYPQPVPNPARAGIRFWFMLPIITLRLSVRLGRLNRTLAAQLRDHVIPEFVAETSRGAAEDLTQLEPAHLLDRLEYWIQRTLHDFARDSLKPTVLAGISLENLERKLGKVMRPEQVRAALGELVMGVHPDPEADLPSAIQELEAGRLERSAFLDRFGHRGSHEMELSQPRWSEDHGGLDRMLAAAGVARETGRESHGATPARFEQAWQQVVATGRMSARQQAAARAEIQTLHTYLGLRETAKHYLMKGYALIRRVLLELDRRFALDGNIFFLTPEELPRLVAGENLSALVGKRQQQRELALSLEVPQVLFSDDLEAIGRPVTLTDADTLQGVPLSAGVAEGPALVLQEPTDLPPPAEPFILVCPSTDPAWVPLFVHACGLVMETGGVLSHGAIVAREFGLPAVAGLADVHRRLRTGQRLRVDGSSGTVTVLK